MNQLRRFFFFFFSFLWKGAKYIGLFWSALSQGLWCWFIHGIWSFSWFAVYPIKCHYLKRSKCLGKMLKTLGRKNKKVKKKKKKKCIKSVFLSNSRQHICYCSSDVFVDFCLLFPLYYAKLFLSGNFPTKVNLYTFVCLSNSGRTNLLFIKSRKVAHFIFSFSFLK